MRIQINLTGKHIITLFITALAAAAVNQAGAFYSNNPTVMGHTISEIQCGADKCDANSDDIIDMATTADYATNAGHATSADSAISASNINTGTYNWNSDNSRTVNVDYATNAGDADTLDGLHANEIGGKWSGSGNDIYYNDGNVGIGVTEPKYRFEVNGNARFSGSVRLANAAGNYLKLPHLTTAQRDALSPETGMLIYNTDTRQIEGYVPSQWEKIIGGKSVGESCNVPADCATNFCVDGFCCDSPCNDKTCQTCGPLSSNGAGYCGYVVSGDPDNECTAGSSSSDGCRKDECSGTGYSCGVYTSGDHGCPVCQTCSDSDAACENYPEYAEDTGCNQICRGCSNGYCINIPVGQKDTYGTNQCTATHYACNGAGSCTAPKGYVCINHPYAQPCNLVCTSNGFDSCEGTYCNTGDCTGYKWTCNDYWQCSGTCKCYGYIYN